MSGAFLQIEVKDQGLTDLVNRITGHMSNMTPVFKVIGEIVLESVQRNFEGHRSPEGKKWEKLSPDYAAWKAKKGKNAADILIFNRILMGSIHPKAESDRAQVGTNIVYAAVHQFGIGRRSNLKTKREMGAIPARPFLGVRDDDWPWIRAAVETFLTHNMD
jgi:phage virion morphogenesis protein